MLKLILRLIIFVGGFLPAFGGTVQYFAPPPVTPDISTLLLAIIAGIVAGVGAMYGLRGLFDSEHVQDDDIIVDISKPIPSQKPIQQKPRTTISSPTLTTTKRVRIWNPFDWIWTIWIVFANATLLDKMQSTDSESVRKLGVYVSAFMIFLPLFLSTLSHLGFLLPYSLTELGSEFYQAMLSEAWSKHSNLLNTSILSLSVLPILWIVSLWLDSRMIAGDTSLPTITFVVKLLSILTISLVALVAMNIAVGVTILIGLATARAISGGYASRVKIYWMERLGWVSIIVFGATNFLLLNQSNDWTMTLLINLSSITVIGGYAALSIRRNVINARRFRFTEAGIIALLIYILSGIVLLVGLHPYVRGIFSVIVTPLLESPGLQLLRYIWNA